MKLSDFYRQKKYPVTSVNNKVGDVTLNATDVNAVGKNQIGILIPSLKNGVVPDTQLPDYAKLVNGKLLSVNIPNATDDRVGGIILGQGFEQEQNGVINAIGVVSKQQKIEKIDIIKIDGNGHSVLTDNGRYANVVQSTQTRIQFSQLNSENNVVFHGNVPIVSILSQNNNYYTVQSGDITYNNDTTILHMSKYLIQQNINSLNAPWVAFIASAVKFVDANQDQQKCKSIAFTQALIYG